MSFHSPRCPFVPSVSQNLSLRIEFQHGVRADVGCPDVSVLIDAQAVGSREKAFAKRPDELSVVIELVERRIAARQNPEVTFGSNATAAGAPAKFVPAGNENGSATET